MLHDFDKAGFSIVGTLQAQHPALPLRARPRREVIDLGLRLDDVDGLETEDVYVEFSGKAKQNLRENGATEEEIDFLSIEPARRTERLRVRRIRRVDRGQARRAWHRQSDARRDVLAAAYVRMRRQAVVQARINEVLDKLDDEQAEPPPIPDDLTKRLNELMGRDPAQRWDACLRKIAEEDHKAAP